MKLKSLFFVSLLPLFVVCSGNGKSPVWAGPLRPGEFKLWYRPEISLNPELVRENSERWNHTEVRAEVVEGGVCLFAGAVPVFAVSVCVPDDSFGSNQLEFQNILTFWKRNRKARSDRMVFPFSESGEAFLSVRLSKTITEDLNENWLVLSGDAELDSVLDGIGFPRSNRRSVFESDSEIRPHSVRLWNGFSVFAGPSLVRIIFHSPYILDSENVLVLEIPGDVSVLSDFFVSIEDHNREVAAFCKNELPSLTEWFAGTEAPLGRFFEVGNKNEYAVCTAKADVKLGENEYSLWKKTVFLIPGETILRIETDKPGFGVAFEKFPWASLKKAGSISMTDGTRTKIFSLSERTYEEGDSYYSVQNESYSVCDPEILPRLSDRFCGNPGRIETSNDPIDKRDFCGLDSFRLEEVNFTGIFASGKLEERGKFTDLEFTGEAACDPDSLSLLFAGFEVPIRTSDHRIHPGQILTLGSGDFLERKILLSKANLRKLEYSNSISLLDRVSGRKKELFSIQPWIPVLRRTDGYVLSLLFREGNWIPHPFSGSETILEDLRFKNAMDPGIKTKAVFPEIQPNAEISEVSWMGSYEGNTAISADRFVELDSSTEGFRRLEIGNDSPVRSYLIPLSKGKNVFSSGNLVCFPDAISWILPELSLGSSGTIRLLPEEGIFVSDRLVWNQQTGPGVNSTSQKTRRSAVSVRTLGGERIWKSSGLSDPTRRKTSCPGTEASPGEENRIHPFLYKENGNLSNALDPILSWNFPGFLDVSEITLLQNTPAQTQSERRTEAGRFLEVWSSLLPVLSGGFVFQKDILTYLFPSFGEGLILIPASTGILIDSVYPHPAVSSNEWFTLCNRSDFAVDMRSLEIRDSSAADRIVEYSARFGNSLPEGWNSLYPNSQRWIFNERFLYSGECGYVLSPGFKNETLPFTETGYGKIFTIDKTATIGNGISKNEGLDLFQERSSGFVHLHSYGNQRSPRPATIDADTGNVIRLKAGKTGGGIEDYSILIKESL
ncbi:hypothetical protein EHQ12_11040 [Leptospira gomenensis]|uniref:Lipoprotein n=1 Tax=Leptospira gomenensis TaxID=2484974 RepID=A0A5F1YTS0_9LEPT|nr:hypothetical protein [Leptospira gomenensis]TGK35193.1 hypothetical protein EHQ17_07060 [Leptospira gomenensis]TGK37402.1 hypothetical protein EHQ12_11040 [Leptospira gomenensis]TGK41054.1 hypothetical protein EHQ07_16820 [Leptospira gomenensis]TGK61284.1 hypothetical protein EHQ13_09500 [Leptospira gomenensis]